MKKIEQAFHKIIFTEMVFSVIYAILGLIIFLYSDMTNKTVGLLIGIFLLINGFLTIFTFIDKAKINLFHYNLFFGIASIILGIFIMFNPLSILNFLNITLGIWLVVESLNKIFYFFSLKKIKESSSKVILVSAILLFFLGITIIVNPFRSTVITKSVGVFVMLYNIVNLNDLVLLKRRSKNFLKLFK